MSTRAIMWVAGAWTVLVWGTRIPLLESDATSGDWSRIAIGLGAGLLVLVVALRHHALRPRVVAWMSALFAFAMIGLWLPSLISVWSTENSLGFRLVHTVLAGVSMGFGVALAQRAQDTFRARPGGESAESDQNVGHIG